MSRIQDILDKAEREGSVRRMRTVAEPAVALQGVATSEASASTAEPFQVLHSGFAGPIDRLNLAGAGLAAPPARTCATAQLDPQLVSATAATGVVAEQFRALRTRIVHTESGRAVTVVLVTSPGRGEGKSLTVANLGLTMAQEYQQRICVVDADLRSPRQASLFGVPEVPGLSDVVMGRATLDDALIRVDEHQITVLPAGEPATHPAELLGTDTMRRTLDTLRARFDRVIIDAPAVTPLADVGILTPLTDSVLLVVRAGVTSKPAIHDAVAAIDSAKLMGFVLNEVAA
jgi:capsular exopolysaccharide synthesis family protein